MKRRTIGIAVVIVAGVVIVAVQRRPVVPSAPPSPPPAKAERSARRPAGAVPPAGAGIDARPDAMHAAAAPMTAEEKAARIEQIKKDYDEIRNKAAADYSAAAANFPGGLNAFLRQLALLEREKRADFARVLNPRELEDLELRETMAGQMVQRWLGDTTATDEQRRSVFRLQHAFEDRFALTFDLTPPALFERETARHQVQEQIRAVLGDALFAQWLRGEGPDYANFAKFAAEQGLPPDAPLNLWRAKNEFTERRLQLSAQKLPAEQLRAAQAALVQQTETRVLGILGQGAMAVARREILNWLPTR